jgi:peptidyl-prolyl cis-trans isomerase B (cyclophilin B)
MLKNLSSMLLIAALFACLPAARVAGQDSAEQPVPREPKKINTRPLKESSKNGTVEPFEKATVEMMKSQCVKFETEKGAIELEMYPESAPESVRNFLNLVALGAYDTTTFNRVVPGFIIQGGEMSTRPQIKRELFERARRNVPDEPSLIRHERGILSLARTDKPNSASSDFFILAGDAPHLDRTFAAFGRVTQGMETVDAINKVRVENEKPEKPVRLTRASISPCTVETKP